MSPPRTATAHGDLTIEQWRAAVTLVDWDRALVLALAHCTLNHDHPHKQLPICGEALEAVLRWDYDNPIEQVPDCRRCAMEEKGHYVD